MDLSSLSRGQPFPTLRPSASYRAAELAAVLRQRSTKPEVPRPRLHPSGVLRDWGPKLVAITSVHHEYLPGITGKEPEIPQQTSYAWDRAVPTPSGPGCGELSWRELEFMLEEDYG